MSWNMFLNWTLWRRLRLRRPWRALSVPATDVGSPSPGLEINQDLYDFWWSLFSSQVQWRPSSVTQGGWLKQSLDVPKLKMSLEHVWVTHWHDMYWLESVVTSAWPMNLWGVRLLWSVAPRQARFLRSSSRCWVSPAQTARWSSVRPRCPSTTLSIWFIMVDTNGWY